MPTPRRRKQGRTKNQRIKPDLQRGNVIPRVLHPSAREIRPEARRLRALLVPALLLSLVLFSTCAPPGPSTPVPEAVGPPVPSIYQGEVSRSQARAGVELLGAAQDSLEAGAYQAAVEAAERVIRSYPALQGSSRALWIQAEAHEAMDQPGEAAEAAGRFADLLGPEHPLFPEAVLLQAKNLEASGAAEEAMTALLPLPSETPDSIVKEAEELLREVISTLPFQDLQRVTRALGPESPLRGLFAAELAVAVYLQGNDAEARLWADTALQAGVDSREDRLVRGVLEGRLEEVLGMPVLLGVVLPMSGVSPGLAQYGEWVQEGIEVALEVYRDSLPRQIEMEVVDDRGMPLGARTAVRTLEESGAMAAIGFIGQDLLSEAAETREGGFPLLSPFSFLPSDEATGVFSLSGPDLGEAIQLARIGRELELETVAVVRPSTMQAEMDAAAFREEFERLGGRVPREIVYDSGGTFFQPQFQQVEEILPDGLFLPLEPRDIQLLAPQVTFYGLDTLGVQILGTSGWTDPMVVQEVDSRHTDGVVAATARLTQDETESFRRFRESYEAHFSRTLRSEVPALGYDAAALFMEALKAGPRTRDELLAALEEVRGLHGATGILSVEGGRVTRQPLLVRIQDHELIYMTRRNDR